MRICLAYGAILVRKGVMHGKHIFMGDQIHVAVPPKLLEYIKPSFVLRKP